MLCALQRARRLRFLQIRSGASQRALSPAQLGPTPPGKRSCREEWPALEMRKTQGRGTPEAGQTWCEQRVVQCHRQAVLLPCLGFGWWPQNGCSWVPAGSRHSNTRGDNTFHKLGATLSAFINVTPLHHILFS